MLCYKMSLVLLKSFVSEITANDAKMAQNKKNIDDIKSQLMFMNEYIKELKDFDELQVAADAEAAVIIAGIQAEILALKAFDVKEEKEEDEIREDIKDIQQKIAALKAKIALQDAKNAEDHDITDADIKELVASDALQVAVDVEAAVIIAGLQAEILALKAANNVQDDGEKIIKKDVGVLQVEVKDLKSKEETEKFDEIANLELMITRLKEKLVELNGGVPILNGGEKPSVGGIGWNLADIGLDILEHP